MHTDDEVLSLKGPASRSSGRIWLGVSLAVGFLATSACGNDDITGPPAAAGASGASGAAGSSSGRGGSGPVPPVTIPPGVNVVRRLNRVEYSNTVHDLLGETLPVGESFPSDETNSFGFDNDGASLNVSSLLVERWVDVAGRLVESLFARLSPLDQPFTNIVNGPCDNIRMGIDVCGPEFGISEGGFYSWRVREDPLVIEGLTVPADGLYKFSLDAYADPVISTQNEGVTKAGQPYPVVLQISLDGTGTNFDITEVTRAAPRTIEVDLPFAKGRHTVIVRVLQNENDPDNADDHWYANSQWVANMRLRGPLQGDVATPNVLECLPAALDPNQCARDALTAFATRAFRRPATTEEIDGLMALVDATKARAEEPGDDIAKTLQGVKLAMQATLASPHFVFRPELSVDTSSRDPQPVNGYELASRLSYFLWSTMPDDELFTHAGDGTLLQSAELTRQITRMLQSPRAEALVKDFAGQWLALRQVKHVSPLPARFPDFTSDVKLAIERETSLFFAEFLKPGNSYMDLVDANFTFVNAPLAEYYGLDSGSLSDDAFTRVTLPASSHRGGILGQASLLTETSHANRTSPVLRGKFVLAKLLCSAPPPPPANVPPFNEDESAGSVRQRLETHRQNDACAGCHTQMDTIGFALENFDAAGAYRTTDDRGGAIDTTGLDLEGTPISDRATLAAAIKANPGYPDCVVRHLYSYAVGRAVTLDDAAAVTELTNASAQTGYELPALIEIIAKSPAFLNHLEGQL